MTRSLALDTFIALAGFLALLGVVYLVCLGIDTFAT